MTLARQKEGGRQSRDWRRRRHGRALGGKTGECGSGAGGGGRVRRGAELYVGVLRGRRSGGSILLKKVERGAVVEACWRAPRLLQGLMIGMVVAL